MAVLGFAQLAVPVEHACAQPVRPPTLRVTKFEQLHLVQATQVLLGENQNLPRIAAGHFQTIQGITVKPMIESQEFIQGFRTAEVQRIRSFRSRRRLLGKRKHRRGH